MTPIDTDYQSRRVGRLRDYTEMSATIHTHGIRVKENQFFSLGSQYDIGYYLEKNIVGWLANPYGELYRFDVPTYNNSSYKGDVRSGLYCTKYPDSGLGCLE